MKFCIKMIGNILAIFSLFASGHAQSQDWPRESIRIIVPYPAGGAVDILTRALAQQISGTLGQSVIVEAKPGASSNIGAAYVANAKPDGYTLLATSQWLTLNPLIEDNLHWKETSLVPVAKFAQAPNYLAVGFTSPYHTLDEYIAAAKKAPGQFYGSTGLGSTQELTMAVLKSSAGIKLTPVLYKGAPPIIIDLISGRLSIAAVAAGNVKPFVESKQLRLLVSSGETRSRLFPDVPTLAELKLSKLNVMSWYGIQAPTGTPASVITKIQNSIAKAMLSPTMLKTLSSLDGEPAYLDSPKFAEFLHSETLRWTPVMKSLEREFKN